MQKNILMSLAIVFLAICILISSFKVSDSLNKLGSSVHNGLFQVKNSLEDKDYSVKDEEKIEKIEVDSGKFAGQIDNNFIEIHISGVPQEKGFKVFQVNEDIKDTLKELDLEKGDNIRFEYIIKKMGNPMIIKIEKI